MKTFHHVSVSPVFFSTLPYNSICTLLLTKFCGIISRVFFLLWNERVEHLPPRHNGQNDYYKRQFSALAAHSQSWKLDNLSKYDRLIFFSCQLTSVTSCLLQFDRKLFCSNNFCKVDSNKHFFRQISSGFFLINFKSVFLLSIKAVSFFLSNSRQFFLSSN